MHPVPRFFLFKRHSYVRTVLKNSKVLDLGCNRYKILASAVGVDVDGTMHPDVCGSALSLPFEDEHFDTVTALELIEHFDRDGQDTFLREVHRVLKRRGQFVVSTPNISEATRKLHDTLYYVSHMVYAPQDVHAHIGELTHHQLKQKLITHDFTIVSEKAFTVFNYVVECMKP